MNKLEKRKAHAAYMRQHLATDDWAYLKNAFYRMRFRCFSEKSKDYPRYGGRGIGICEAWLQNPDSFVEWSLDNGWKRGLEIDRTDNSGSYAPENCRWVEKVHNARNRRNNKLNAEKVSEIRALLASGLSYPEIASKFQVHRALIYRIHKNQQWVTDPQS